MAPYLSLGDQKRLRITLPPPDRQQLIGCVLGSLDDKIDLNRRMNETLEAIARALFRSWFVDFDPVRAKQEGRQPPGLDAATAALFPDSFADSPLGPIPAGWTVKPFFEVAELISGGTPATSMPTYWGGGIPWASAKDVSQCSDAILVCTERTITEEGLSNSSTKIVPKFTTVVGSGQAIRAHLRPDGQVIRAHRSPLLRRVDSFGISHPRGGKDMRTVDDYAKYRTAHRDGMTIRQIARSFHVSRRKVREALTLPEPKPYTRTKPPPAPVLGPFQAVIDQVLRDDRDAPPKQRHTAAQLFRRLQDEHEYPGSYPTVRRYVADHRRRSRATFIPLAHPPGSRLEADFGHIHVDFPEGRRLVPFLVTVWAYSNAPFVLALPTERTEAVLDGMVRALEFFAAVPREVWWDNPRTVATLILRGRQRLLHPRYAALASHYTFEAKFCMPAQAHEKPDVESGVCAVQRRFATPVPRVAGIGDLNEHMRARCLDELRRTVRSASGAFVIGDRFAEEVAAAARLPQRAFDPCVDARPSSTSTRRWRSMPTATACRGPGRSGP